MEIDIDSRPSDAIAIALKRLVPVYITNNILKAIKSKDLITKQHFPEQFSYSKKNRKKNYDTKDIINNLMEALDKAIDEENYEIAAKLRDRIKNLKTKKIN